MLTCPARVKTLYICVSLICNRYGNADISHVTISHGHLAPYWRELTRCCVISTAIGVTSSLYSQIIFCMTFVRSSFSVSRTMCRSACITGRMKAVMYSLALKRRKIIKSQYKVQSVKDDLLISLHLQ